MKGIVLENELPKIRKGVLLKEYTTYKIGGPARYFFIVKSKEDLMLAIKAAKKFNLPVFILGGGSNLLISEKGFNGLVIKIDISDVRFQGNEVFAGAGVNLTKLANESAEKGLSGLEWGAGVPGTVGGAIYGHAQAFGAKISDTVKSVEAVDLNTLKIENFSKEECKFSLKNSIFKKNKNLIIVSTVLELVKKDTGEIKNKIKENMNYRETNHPVNFPSAGSTFVNPEAKIKDKKLLEKFPELNEFNKTGVIRAGYLIEKSGLKGKKIGGAQISEKHCNFIINAQNAKAKDVLALIKLANQKVKKVFNVDLETEVQLVGF